MKIAAGYTIKEMTAKTKLKIYKNCKKNILPLVLNGDSIPSSNKEDVLEKILS